MRAIEISTPGGPEVLTEVHRPDPVPGPGEVLIRVAAAGVNRADVHQRQGNYPPPPGASDIPGLECSGVIAGLGQGVDGWQEGDRVAALLAGGGYAELIVVASDQVLPVPDHVDLVDAAGLPEAVCTAWSNLFMVGRLTAGEVVLVHGGSGGVGSAAIQIATALWARVATTAGGPERVAHCIALGAGVGIDHRTEDVAERLAEETAGHGADVILDVLGAGGLANNLRALATGGRLVVIGMQKGRRAELDLGLLMAKRASVYGTTLRARPPQEKAAIVAEVARHAWPLLGPEDIGLRPLVHARVALAEAGRAHEMLEDGQVFGKVVLVP
ncbi:MAG: NAD(P)H-quinone oxidoreductase [Candidatus Nanopelagicales bacterium]